MARWVFLLGLFVVVAGFEPSAAAADESPTELVPLEFTTVSTQTYDFPGVDTPDAGSGGSLSTQTVEADFDMIGLLWDEGSLSELWLQVRNAEGVWSAWIEVPIDADHGPDEGESRNGSAPVFIGNASAFRFVADAPIRGAEAMLISTGSPGSIASSGPAATALALEPPAPSWAGATFVNGRAEWDTTDCRAEDAEPRFSSAKAIVIHHTAGSNSYTAADVPGIIRGHCLYHVNGRGWDDIGYNFLVDRFGNVWEGRTGSKTSPVQGAHTAGFNSQTQGVALMGNFDTASPSSESIQGLRQILDWLTGWHSIDPTGSVTLTAGSGAVGFEEGDQFSSATIVGHRDLGSTTCPGGLFYATLASLRTQVTPLNFGFNPDALICDGKTPTILGTAGNDVIWGTEGPDVIHAVYGHDWVFGLEGDDSICGSSGDDVLIGGPGFDRLFGGSGNDACGGELRESCESIIRTDDEVFFYRSTNGVFAYYDIGADGVLGVSVKTGQYSTGWDSITGVDLEGNGDDEQLFYRSTDGVFKYYGLTDSGSLVGPLRSGTYSKGWDSITSVDLDGDGDDEQFFYRSSDGTFKYYSVNSDGSLQGPIRAGVYSTGWSSITAVDLDGDGRDEQLFYRASDGTFKYYGVNSDGSLQGPIRAGVYSTGWSSITAVDLDGDGRDEQLFYRASDGTFKYYESQETGSLGALVNSGAYAPGWTSISAIQLDEDF